MKKLFVAAVVAMFVFGFASCKSECECYLDGEPLPGTKQELSKSDCKDLDKTQKALFPGESVSCK